MAATLTITSPSGDFTIEGSEREIEEHAVTIAALIGNQGGTWVTNGEWTKWLGPNTGLSLDMGGEMLEALYAHEVPNSHPGPGYVRLSR